MCASEAAPPGDQGTGERPSPSAQAAFAALLDRCGDVDPAALPDTAIQRLLTLAVGAYAARLDAGDSCEPFAQDSGLTASEVCPVVARMLRAVDVDLFELAMWQHLV